MIESQLNKIMCYFKDWRKDREERKGKLHLHQLKKRNDRNGSHRRNRTLIGAWEHAVFSTLQNSIEDAK